MPQLTVEQAFQIAFQYHQAGKLSDAEEVYRQIIAQQPNHVNTLHFLGVIANERGENDVAVELIRRAISLHPNYPEANNNLGNALLAKGKTDEAIVAYRRAIALDPNYADAHSHLGNALKNNGQFEEAIASYRRAIALDPKSVGAYSNLGSALKDRGELDGAIAAFRQATVVGPNHAQAHYNLGVALGAGEKPDEAIAAYRRAIALKPDHADAYNNLGIALAGKGRLDEAISAYRRAVAVNPKFAGAYVNLGVSLKNKGEVEESIAAFRKAIALDGNHAEAHCNLANAMKAKGQIDEAIVAYHRAIALNPSFAEAYSNLGIALVDKGQLDEAVAAHYQAIALQPGFAAAHSNLGNALTSKGQLEMAIAAHLKAIELNPAFFEAHNNLGIALAHEGQLDEAIAAYRRAIGIEPGFAAAYNNLGNALKNQGQVDEAIAAHRQAIALNRNYPEAHSNLVMDLHYHPGYDAVAIAEEHRRWNRDHAEPVSKGSGRARSTGSGQAYLNNRDPDRRVRVGYVSPDFRDHPVGRFIEPLLAHHDRSQFEIIAFAHVPVPDERTQRLRSHTDAWHSIVGLNDAQVADWVRREQIDILVDLAMHTAGSRLLVFARKPAPVQVTYLAYCSSAGLETIDYRLSDPYLDPAGGDESIYGEKTIRLPETYWCYQSAGASGEVGSVPAVEKGVITFGSLNNFCKVSEPVLQAWAKILRAVPNSRLLLHAHEGNHRQRVRQQLEREGIESHRLEFIGFVRPEKYFELYRRIDIALDTFPFAGGTTTCDALWMGVPVVSLAGKTAAGRGGLSILSNVGLPDLVADSQEAYVKLAIELANDLPRLIDLRSTLRQRMQQSPLMDAPRFARNIEVAYRQMWRNWCDRETGSTSTSP